MRKGERKYEREGGREGMGDEKPYGGEKGEWEIRKEVGRKEGNKAGGEGRKKG